MKTTIMTRHMELTDSLRNRLEKKIGKLDKFFPAETVAQVRFSCTRNLQICEITIPIEGGYIRGEEAGDDMYACIDRAAEKLERQIIKHKTKLGKRLKAGSLEDPSLPEVEAEEELHIVKRKKFSTKPLDVDEAILQMELLGHSFFVFTNSATDRISVLYRRNDGDLGLIEPDDE